MKSVIIGLFLIIAIAFGSAWLRDGSGAEAHEPHSGLNFSLGVDNDGDTVSDCFASCSIAVGASFNLNVHLNALGGVPSYEAFDTFFTYSGAITTIGSPAIPWPECVFPAHRSAAGELRSACTRGIASPASTYTGVIVRQMFECSYGAASITLHHGAAVGDTRLIETLGSMHSEGNGTSEMLAITCEEPPIPYADKTFTNTGNSAASALTTLAWPFPSSVSVVTNAPGCPSPSVYWEFSDPAGISIEWGEFCVDPGESVTVRVYADCPYCTIDIGSGTWTYADADTDGDGCPDIREQQTATGSQLSGGRRSYLNPYDYFNPTHDHENRLDDVLMVVQAYYNDDSDDNPGEPPYAPGYNPDTDRADDPAYAEDWRLLAGNGYQRVGDILAVIRQYFHDC
jgi:hypothetical protein